MRQGSGRRILFTAIAVSALLSVGCSGSTTSSLPIQSAAPTVASLATEAPTAAPTGTPEQTVAPTPIPSAMALCASPDASGLKGCPLPAGTYTSAPFEVPFRFTIPDGWANHNKQVEGGEIRKGDAVGLAWAVHMADVSPTIGASTEALFKFFRTQPVVTASAPVPVTIGGIEGSSMDLSIGTKGKVLFHSVSSADHGTSWRFSPGTKVRMMAVEVHDTLVLLMADVTPIAGFEGQMTSIQPILDSIAWE
jgi:hypothetical protein